MKRETFTGEMLSNSYQLIAYQFPFGYFHENQSIIAIVIVISPMKTAW